MPKSSPEKLAYNTKYESSLKEIKLREARNKARALEMKAGKVKKGDKKEVDHIKMLDAGGKNIKKNLRVVPESVNRSWRDEHGKVYGKNKK
jgi:hypothetical protein